MKHIVAQDPKLKALKERVELATKLGADIERLYENVMVTPVAAEEKFLEYLGELKEKRIVKNVIFDSGGFQVKTGRKIKGKRLTFTDLFELNNALYEKYDFADWVILPDAPPIAADPEPVYVEKCKQTIKVSSEFFNQLPDRFKEKSIPCFHMKNIKYFDLFYEGHYPIFNQTKYVACATHVCKHDKSQNLDSFLVIDYLNKELKKENIKLHLLGVGSPSTTYILNYIDLYSADSSIADMEAIRFGIIFPFKNNISVGDRKKNSITQEDLERLKETTGHRCVFCEDLEKLRSSGPDGTKSYRLLHNQTVCIEMAEKYPHLGIETFFEKVTNKRIRKVFTDFLSIRGDFKQGQLF